MRRAIWDSIWGSVAIVAIFIAALFLVPVSSAKAADKGKPTYLEDLAEPAAAKPRWGGAYIGIVGSYDRQSAEVDSLSFNADDFAYGVTVGFDHQLPGTAIVLGVMGDYTLQQSDSALVEWDSSWSAAARAGILFSPTTLGYVLAGYTAMDGDFTVPTSASLPDKGVTLGLGMETYILKNLTLKAEYRWVDLGEEDLGGGVDLSNDLHQIRLGLNYRF